MSWSDWLEGHARFRPDSEALFDADTGRRWTYAALHNEGLRWAGRLSALGVARGDRVALLAQNRGETFAILFACAELGAVLFPMNWRLAPDELSWQLGNAEPRVLIVDADHSDTLSAPSISLEDGPGDTVLHGPGADLDDPWQLMYTSGSSGRPKGALECFGFIARALPHLISLRQGPVADASHGDEDGG